MGTVFKITPDGAYTVLHGFHGLDGSSPAGLALASDWNFYGTTGAGGSLFGTGVGGAGTVFKITPSGTLTTLHSFNRTGVGGDPAAPLIQGSDGDLYGTTLGGGAAIFGCTSFGFDGCGTVFKISPSGTFTSLLSFDLSDGALPFAPVVQASDGNLYGTTFAGGYGYGTVFKITTGGKLTVLHRFPFNAGETYAGLVQGTDGNLYGGEVQSSSIFKITPGGAFTTEYVGVGGETALMQSTDGKFYGTSGSEVFSLDMGLDPFVTFLVPTGKVGDTVQVLGQGFKGTTSVAFNGIRSTSFSIISDTYMTAVVPDGATSGRVVVTTPTGALISNVNFRISR